MGWESPDRANCKALSPFVSRTAEEAGWGFSDHPGIMMWSRADPVRSHTLFQIMVVLDFPQGLVDWHIYNIQPFLCLITDDRDRTPAAICFSRMLTVGQRHLQERPRCDALRCWRLGANDHRRFAGCVQNVGIHGSMTVRWDIAVGELSHDCLMRSRVLHAHTTSAKSAGSILHKIGGTLSSRMMSCGIGWALIGGNAQAGRSEYTIRAVQLWLNKIFRP